MSTIEDNQPQAAKAPAIPPIPNLGTRTDEITIYAGPCSIESTEQFDEVAACVAELGLHWIRGGAFKPRTNPHSFQGLGEEGLKIMADAGQKYGLKTLTEVMDSAHCEMVHSYVDGLQVGARNFQNFSLLKNIGHVTRDSHKMVLYKRGFAGSIAEWLAACDYITCEGNDNVVLCERGIRTFETATRFTLDISAVPVVHKQSLYPICIDVSHPAGQRDLVPSLAYAAVAAGCDSIMIEVHPNPPKALSDGPQQLTPAQFTELVAELRKIAAVFGKKIV
ncbi:MAG TPA: 3-deoxy-7-phosphoheptulonate synthase [Candidatus Aphodovivens avistercoris]|nr:3-deoxy-7-phosphoheptulonate synthase [Candidatus Aphodovivens avistercoris]